jgi:cysteine synthase A
MRGVGRVLATERPETQVILAEPSDAPLVSSGTAQQRNADGSPSARHPSWKPHPIQGWSPDFVPKLAGDAVEAGLVDRVITVAAPEAMQWSRQLARSEGIFVGVSAGGTFAAAMQVAREAPQGSTILCMLPDTGERYLSTPLFADVPIDMTDEERELMRSSPTFADTQLAMPPAPVPASV